MIFRIECSAKTLKELGLEKDQLSDSCRDLDPFHCWSCHLFYVERKKCLLFVNHLTRYPVFRCFVSRAEIRDLGALLRNGVQSTFEKEGVPLDTIETCVGELAAPSFSKSSNRSITGTAVDYVRLLDYWERDQDRENKRSFEAHLSTHFARVPSLAMKPESFPYKRMKEEILARYGKTGLFPPNEP